MSDVHEERGAAGDDAESTSARPAIGGCAAAFAASVAGRGRPRRSRRAPIARVWRRSAPVARHRSTTVGVTYAPVLRISIIAAAAGDSGAGCGARASDAFVPPVARTFSAPSAPERPSLGVSIPATATTVARLVARGAREDGSLRVEKRGARLAGLTEESSSDRPSLRVARPVARVLRANAAMQTAEPSDALSRAPSPKSVAAAVAPVLSASEVNRVTEHVLRTMDRRISAFRERQGRD